MPPSPVYDGPRTRVVQPKDVQITYIRGHGRRAVTRKPTLTMGRVRRGASTHIL
jgi:hypothetical protein